MLKVTSLPRIFKATVKGQDIELADPSPTMSPESVVNFYANTYPELVTSTVTGPEVKDDTFVYKISSVMGTKG